MTDPIPINLARAQQKAAQQEAKQRAARQVMSQSRFEESVEEGFNPAAAEREQGRLGRFRTLETRRRSPTQEARRIQEVEAKAEEDLAHNFERRNSELPASRLRALLAALRQGASPEEVLHQVTSAFKDPTLADEALEYLEHTTEGDLRDSVLKAREMLREAKGREILAGRNVDSAAKAFAQKGAADSPTALRDLYRDITGNPRGHNTLFAELSEEYSYEQLELVVAFLLKGLGYDLKSKGPSIQQAELMRLMTEVRNLQSILWIYLYFRSRMKLMRMLYSQYGGTPSKGLSFEKLAKQFIKLVEERYPSIMKLLKLGEELGLDDIGKVIVFMQYRDAIRQLAPRIYRSVKHRQDLLLVILETLEELEEEPEDEDDSI